MKYIDYKCTTWNRINLPDDVDIDEVKEMIKDRLSIDDIIEKFDNMNIEWESLTDTEEYIYPEDNYGSSTIELFEDLNLITDNHILDEIES